MKNTERKVVGKNVEEEPYRDNFYIYGSKKTSENVLWGILLIAAGIIFLLNNMNIVSWHIWEYLKNFWPILLILFGFQVLLGNTLLARFIMAVITFCTVGTVILYALVQVQPVMSVYIPSFLSSLFAILANINP